MPSSHFSSFQPSTIQITLAKRLHAVLKELGAEPDRLGQARDQLLHLCKQTNIDNKLVIDIYDLLFLCRHPWELNRENVHGALIITIQNLLAELKIFLNKYHEIDKESVLLEPLSTLCNYYQHCLQILIEGSDAARKSLLTDKVQLWVDCIEVPYLVPITIACQILCKDDYGNNVKSNNQGIHAVQRLGSTENGYLFFKPNKEGKDYINPFMEYTSVSFHHLFAPPDQLLAAPTSLLKLRNISVEPSDLSASHPISLENVVQVGYGLGELNLEEMFKFIEMLNHLQITLGEAERLNCTMYWRQGEIINNWLKAFPIYHNLTQLETDQVADILCNYLLGFIAEHHPTERPLQLDILDSTAPANLKNSWGEKIIKHFGLKTVITFLGLVWAYPALMKGKSLDELLAYPELLTWLEKLWPGRSLAEQLNNADKWLVQGERSALTRLAIVMFLSQPSDDKADNFQVIIQRDSNNQAVSWFCVSIDSDKRWANSIVYQPKMNVHFPGVKTFLYGLSHVMEQPISIEDLKALTSQPAVLAILDWLLQIQQQQYRYKEAEMIGWLQPTDFLEEDGESRLDIPLKFVTGTLQNLFARWMLVQNLCRQAQNTKTPLTLQQLLEALEPVLGLYYGALRERYPQQPYALVRALYSAQSSSSVEAVLANQLAETIKLDNGIGSKTLSEVLETIQVLEVDYESQRTQTLEEAIQEFIYQLPWKAFSLELGYEILQKLSQFELLPRIKLDLDEAIQAHWLRLAVKQGNTAIIQLLVQSVLSNAAATTVTIYSNQYWCNLLQAALKYGLVRTVQFILTADIDITVWQDPNTHETPLHWLVQSLLIGYYTPDSIEKMLSLLLPKKLYNLKQSVLVEKSILFTWLLIACQILESTQASTEDVKFVCAKQLLQILQKHGLDLNASQYTVQGQGITILDMFLESKLTDNEKALNYHPVLNFLLQIGASSTNYLKQWVRYCQKNQLSEAMHFLQRHNPYVDWLLRLTNYPRSQSKLTSAVTVTGVISDDLTLSGATLEILQKRRQLSRSDNIKTIILEETTFKVNTYGIHTVIPFIEQDYAYHAKFDPHNPIKEFAVRELRRQLFPNKKVPLAELWKIDQGNGRATAVNVSQTIEGVNFFDILYMSDQEICLSILAKLSHANFTRLFLTCLLIGPGDLHPQNFIFYQNEQGEYELEPVDNENCFTNPFTLINGNLIINIKNILYLLEFMLKELEPETVKEFITLDGHRALRNWYDQVDRYQTASQELFAKVKLEQTYLHLPLQRGSLATMADKLIQMQVLLREKPDLLAIALLKKIHHRVGEFYENVLIQSRGKNPLIRYKYISAAPNTQCNPASFSTLSNLSQLFQSQSTIILHNQKPLLKTYHNRVAEIDAAFADYRSQLKIKARIDSFLQQNNNNFDEWQEWLQGLLTDEAKQEAFHQLIQHEKFKLLEHVLKNPNQLSKASLISLFGEVAFTDITLTGLTEITNGELTALLKNSPYLSTLNLSDCNQITEAGLRRVFNSCSAMEVFKIAELGVKKLFFTSTTLKVVDVKSCLSLSTVNLDLPNAKKIIIQGHPDLRKIEITAFQLQSLKIKACPELNSEDLIIKTPNLKRLILAENLRLTHLGTPEKPWIFPKLKYLSISYCYSLSKLQLALPQLQQLVLKDLRQLDLKVLLHKLSDSPYFKHMTFHDLSKLDSSYVYINAPNVKQIIISDSFFTPPLDLYSEQTTLQPLKLKEHYEAILEQLTAGSAEGLARFEQLRSQKQFEFILALCKPQFELSDRSGLLKNNQFLGKLLKLMVGLEFQELDLTIFANVLTDDSLIELLKYTGHCLKKLKLSRCILISLYGLQSVAKYCDVLEHLDISYLTQLALISGLSFNNLVSLNINYCEQLKLFEINAPNLQELNAENCVTLTLVMTNSLSLRNLNIMRCESLLEEKLVKVASQPWALEKFQYSESSNQISFIRFRIKYPFLFTVPLFEATDKFIEIIDSHIQINFNLGLINNLEQKKQFYKEFNIFLQNSKRFVDLLMQSAKEKNKQERAISIAWLGKLEFFNAKIKLLLFQALKDSDIGVRLRAAVVLWCLQYSNQEVIHVFLDIICNTEVHEVPSFLADEMRKLLDELLLPRQTVSLEVLTSILQHPSQDIKEKICDLIDILDKIVYEITRNFSSSIDIKILYTTSQEDKYIDWLKIQFDLDDHEKHGSLFPEFDRFDYMPSKKFYYQDLKKMDFSGYFSKDSKDSFMLRLRPKVAMSTIKPGSSSLWEKLNELRAPSIIDTLYYKYTFETMVFDCLEHGIDGRNSESAVTNLIYSISYTRNPLWFRSLELQLDLDSKIKFYEALVIITKVKTVYNKIFHSNLAWLLYIRYKKFNKFIDLTQVEQFFKTSITYKSYDSLVKYGEFMFYESRYDEAVPYFMKTIELYLDNLKKGTVYGGIVPNIIYTLDDVHVIEECLKLELQYRSKLVIRSSILAYRLLIKCFYLLKLYDKARNMAAEFNSIIEIEINALRCLAQDKYRIDTVEKEINAASSLSYTLLGYSYQELEMIDSAVVCFKKVLEFEPHNILIKNILATLIEQKSFDFKRLRYTIWSKQIVDEGIDEVTQKTTDLKAPGYKY